jgi:hypothetical protein
MEMKELITKNLHCIVQECAQRDGSHLGDNIFKKVNRWYKKL